MEVTISVVASELVSLFVSFLMSKYHSSSHAQSEEKVVDRLQHLLIRVGTMVKEADSQYISNSRMMMQLKMLPEDTVCLIPRAEKDDKAMRLKPHGALESLKIAVANKSEFVVLLGGCGVAVGKKTSVAHVCGDDLNKNLIKDWGSMLFHLSARL
uniref:Rx N-terminal domain-containing protein n=1 Tax=Aegilops tauschii TaxID=37682 RepID=M8BSV2_AEGTA